jgi:hypothetical protein
MIEGIETGVHGQETEEGGPPMTTTIEEFNLAPILPHETEEVQKGVATAVLTVASEVPIVVAALGVAKAVVDAA